MASAILLAQKSRMVAIMTTVTIDFYSFVSTVERTTAEYPEYMEISVMGIRYILMVSVVMCAQSVEHDVFRSLLCCTMARKASMILKQQW